jgi:hypothetical protein
MDTRTLDEAITDSELHHINFFNGRLLTGGDLEAEQSVQHAHSRRLGAAIGEGVVSGLQVTEANASPPEAALVNITKGLAVNRAGQTLRLECDQQIALTRAPEPAAKNACVFKDCEPAAAGKPLRSGSGYYLLTIGPASRPEGSAPVNGLGNTTAICNSRFFAEGVRFQLFLLNLPVNATPRARSLLSRACFGIAPGVSPSDAWPGALPGSAYGWETLVPPAFDRNREVPLAVLEWSQRGIEFLRRWPVRRRVAAASAVESWGYLTSARRVAEGEAMFLDFQDELETLSPGFAGDSFSFLPAGGILPPRSNWRRFLGPLAPALVIEVDYSLWPRLLHETFTREPVSLPAADATSFNVPDFAAMKVYQVLGRAEFLFARSPLGRLRLFHDSAAAHLQAVIVRAGDGSIRTFEITSKTKSPLIVDDLPGLEVNLWLVRATLPDKPPRKFVEQAQIDFEAAAEKAKKVTEEYKAARADIRVSEKARTVSGLAKGVNASVDTIELGQQALFAQAEALQLRMNWQQAILDENAAVSGRVEPDSDFFSRFIGTPDLTEMLRLAPTTSIIPQGPVSIVHGRTTDLRIPPPPSRTDSPRGPRVIVGSVEPFNLK